MKMIEAMTGAADAQDEVVEQPYEKSGAFIGGLIPAPINPTMAVRDLRVYAEFLDGEVRHYHDRSGLECDAVVHLGNGAFALIEVKLGGRLLIEEGVKTLMMLDELIRAKKGPPPAFKMVLTAVGQFAYRRPADGVVVCPIGCLKM